MSPAQASCTSKPHGGLWQRPLCRRSLAEAFLLSPGILVFCPAIAYNQAQSLLFSWLSSWRYSKYEQMLPVQAKVFEVDSVGNECRRRGDVG